MANSKVYREVCDLVSKIGNKYHEAQAGTECTGYRSVKVRPKDFKDSDLRLPEEVRDAGTQVIHVRRLADGNFYMPELRLTVSRRFLDDARAYRELFTAMERTPIDPAEVARIKREINVNL